MFVNTIKQLSKFDFNCEFSFSGYASGYNMLHKDVSGLSYMPESMENVNFFHDK